MLQYASRIIRIIFFYNEKVSNDSMEFLEPKQQLQATTRQNQKFGYYASSGSVAYKKNCVYAMARTIFRMRHLNKKMRDKKGESARSKKKVIDLQH